MVVWKTLTLFNVWRRTMVHSYSKKMLESGDKHITKQGIPAADFTADAAAIILPKGIWLGS